jgi:4-azaleucine resistance transporter AzlC
MGGAAEAEHGRARAGVAHALGAAAGYVPVGVAFGAIAVQAGMPGGLAVLMSVTVYAGAAQLASLQALAAGAHPLVAAAGMLLVNLRHVPMSLAVGPRLRRFDRRHRALLAQTLTDEAFALDLRVPAPSLPFLYGIHLTCWVAWVGSTAAGVALGPVLPATWTAFALPGLFVALAVEALAGVRGRLRPLVAGAAVVAVAVSRLAGGLADVLAVAGLTAALTAAAGRWRLAAPPPTAAPAAPHAGLPPADARADHPPHPPPGPPGAPRSGPAPGSTPDPDAPGDPR